jgi:hypothetical protein
MDPQREKFLNLKILPARLNVQEVGWLLGFATHDIPILVAKGLLKPLGQPTTNAIKFFALASLQELREDPRWLGRATETICQHWRLKNVAKQPTSVSRTILDPSSPKSTDICTS